MTNAAHEEVRQAVDRAVENLKTLANKHPTSPLNAGDFNKLLQRAKATFGGLGTVQDIDPLTGGTTVADIMLKLSILQGAIHSWFTEQTARMIEEHNRRQAQYDNPWS